MSSKSFSSAKDFFNAHAKGYRKKYDGDDPFYQYFFFERMETATDNIDFQGKSILDIGSGTGGLYDFLVLRGANFERFIATDISEGMLAESNVPVENKKSGNFLEMHFDRKFDYVFMLGVTTYLDPNTCKSYFDKIETILNSGGKVIFTITNRYSLDIKMRNAFKPIVRLFARENRIISQDFQTWYYSEVEISGLLSDHLEQENLVCLNQTFFPVSRLLPRLSILLAKMLKSINKSRLLKWLSSDLLLVYFKV